MKTFKTALSLFLALCMALSLVGVTAWAEQTVINRDITAEGLGWVVGIGSEPGTKSYDEVDLITTQGTVGGMKVNGNVSAKSDGSITTVSRADGIFVAGGQDDITVNGNVSATAEGNAYGMNISTDFVAVLI